MASDWAWDERLCPRQLWLGGRGDGGGSSAEGLVAALGPAFRLVKRAQLPVLTRATEREFRLTLLDASVWRREE